MFSLMKAYIKYNLMNNSEAYKNKEYTSSALLGYNLCDTVHIKVVHVSWYSCTLQNADHHNISEHLHHTT